MKKLLLIEDDAALSRLLGQILKNSYDVTVVTNDLDAWSWLSDGNHPDLIVYDLNVPADERLEFLEHIRVSGFFHSIPVIVLAGKSAHEQQQKCIELGASSFIAKPFEPQTLLSAIRNGLLHKNEVVLID